MRRLTAPLIGLGLLVASCGGGQITEESFETVPEPSTTVDTTDAPITDAGDSTTTSAAPPATSEPAVVDGPPAPDFALALHDGLGFILSEEQKPVYMVFWAEW